MRKRVILVFAVMLAMSITACGKAEENSQPQQTTENGGESNMGAVSNPETDAVVLGDYKNLTITVNAEEPDEETIGDWLQDFYSRYVTAENGGITDRAVAVGDTVVIDYEGKKDGVAFAGGTAKGADLAIGSKTFIDGFEDGLVGVLPGETVDLNLTFPENYGNAELAGQAVVFTVTVHYIRPDEIPVSEMKDEVAVSIGREIIGDTSITTIAGVQDFIRSYLDQQYQAALQSSAVSALVEQCSFGELSEDMLSVNKQKISDYLDLENFEANNGFSADAYFGYYYNMTAQDYVNLAAEQAAKQNLALAAVAGAEGIEVSDAEVQKKLEEYADIAGVSVEDFKGQTSDEDWKITVLNDKVVEFLLGNATIEK